MKNKSFTGSLIAIAMMAGHLLSPNAMLAQETTEKGFDVYGHIRTDFFAQSRNCVNSVNDLFSLFAAPEGQQASAGMHSITTRMGADFYAPGVLGAKQAKGKIEADFSGGSDYVWIRLRQAYTQLQWEHSSLLLGQTWHPMFTSHIMPTTLNINTGSPFNPFNRSPQIRYNHHFQDLTLTAAAIYQTMYKSAGPKGNSIQYQKDAVIPNVFLGLDYRLNHLTFGLGADYKAIKPISEVNRLVHGFSGIAYADYQKDLFRASGKVLYGENLSDHNIIGGYYIDRNKEYHKYKSFATYANISYGQLHKAFLLAGYSANLGTQEKINSNGDFYGFGIYKGNLGNRYIGDLFRVSLGYTYNPTNWRIGIELEYNNVTWCELALAQLVNPVRHDVFRLDAAAVYFF